MDKIIFASFNNGKVREVQNILTLSSHEIIPLKKDEVPLWEENAPSFIENAFIKARHVAKRVNLPVIADDSGLSVDVLDGAPGVYSSRFAGINASDEDNRVKLISELKNRGLTSVKASFHCFMVFLESATDPLPIICHGVWQGEVITECRGENGFGYDPMFYISDLGKTSAELSFGQKNKMSHRFNALQELKAKMKERGLE